MLDANDLVLFDDFLLQGEMVVEIALRLKQLHADVDVLILLLQVVLDEHCLQDDLCVSV